MSVNSGGAEQVEIERLGNQVRELEKIANWADVIIEEMMPQAGKLVFQDYGVLNQLCMALSAYKREKKGPN